MTIVALREQLNVALAKATVAHPWLVSPTERDGVWGLHGEPHDVRGHKSVAYIADVFGQENANAIASLHNAWPQIAATLTALQSEVAVVTAERDAMRVLLERIDDAWCGLTQTHLAASSVGLRLAKAVQNEGYGLHLKIAVKEARIMLAGKAGA